MQHVPIVKDILLIGGGHTHALVIRRWGMKPLTGVRLTLVSRDVLTPYSGMLPGLIAGHYTKRETHIDLSRLCRWAGVRFIEASVSGLDLVANKAHLEGRPALGFDLVSVNTGSTPDVQSVPGAAQFVTPVKPVNELNERWEKLLSRHTGSLERTSAGVGANSSQPAQGNTSGNTSGDGAAPVIAIVGAGVGGFELLLSVHHALSQHRAPFKLKWVVRGEQPLSRQPDKVRQIALQTCDDRGIEVVTGFDVSQVKKTSLHSSDGRSVPVNEVLWCTAASAPVWPGTAGLATIGRGFISVDATLRSVSHTQVFACGDVATLVDTPTAKSGVFAVRQAPVLFENLRRSLLQQNLKRYRPQSATLSLIALGHKTAIASRNGLVLKGGWAWRWKHHIDSQFMNRFSDLPVREMQAPAISDLAPALMPVASHENGNRKQISNDLLHFCGGCGSKVGAATLQRVLQRLEPVQRREILTGLQLVEDSSVMDAGGKLIFQSVDQFRAMLDDPYLFGRITALHALSDLYASTADPLSAQAMITLPFAEAPVQERDLDQLMAGAVVELNAAGCSLVGGHTSVGVEMMLGFAVSGLADAADTGSGLQQIPAKTGDCLLLTKALGSGVILAADMRAEASGPHVAEALHIMLQSNQLAANILKQNNARLLTDVTGFGMLGHLVNLLIKCELDAQIDLAAVPVLDAATHYCQKGIHSSLYRSNQSYLSYCQFADQVPHSDKMPLLLDPQTNGGLLAVVSEDTVQYCINQLNSQGISGVMIGRLLQCYPKDAGYDATAKMQLHPHSEDRLDFSPTVLIY